jgi:hypothetical protein
MKKTKIYLDTPVISLYFTEDTEIEIVTPEEVVTDDTN